MRRRPWLIATVLLVLSTCGLRAADTGTPWMGVLWTKGAVSVGDTRVPSGTTVLPGDVITTSEGASAWIRFRSPASTILLADTQVTVLPSDTAPTLLLSKGTLVVDEKMADPVQVNLPGGYVFVRGDPQAGAECELASLGDAATVSVRRGSAEVHTQGTPMLLHAGQSVRVEADSQGGGQVAGKIDRVIPEGTIQRQGQLQELPLQLNQVIDWNDLVKTLQDGRAQIVLLDGSTLNVGARSEIKILRHDPQAQQTSVEMMRTGEVYANVKTITTSGGKFELRTKSALVGTIDTAFVATTDDKGTRVCGVEGTTQVQSSDPNIHKSVKLRPHECTYVPFGGAPSDPVLDPAQTASLLNETSINNGLSRGALLALGIGLAAATAGAITGIVLATSGTTSPTTP